MYKYQDYRNEMAHRGLRSYRHALLLRAREFIITTAGALGFIALLLAFMIVFTD